MKSETKQTLNPEVLIASVVEAISLTRECHDSIPRIRGMIANLPAGTIHVRHSEGNVKFYEYNNGAAKYLPKSSDRLYLLCRRRYLILLLEILELLDSLYGNGHGISKTNGINASSHSARNGYRTCKSSGARNDRTSDGYDTDGRHDSDGRYGSDVRYGAGDRYGSDDRYGADGRYGTGDRYGADGRYGASNNKHRSKVGDRSSINRFVANIQLKVDNLTAELAGLLRSFADGNLDVARIVMTSAQYKWYTGNYRKKSFNSSKIYTTNSGVSVRSKSERDAGNCYEELAVPFHYEELLIINASSLVKSLEEQLKSRGLEFRSICHVKNGACYWDVPSDLQWMNTAGSLWKSYDPASGKIYIYNDFHTLLADGEMIIHEHEGMLDDFVYRSNADERTTVMIIAKAAKRDNIITTSESDVANMELMKDIIRKRILPRLWF